MSFASCTGDHGSSGFKSLQGRLLQLPGNNTLTFILHYILIIEAIQIFANRKSWTPKIPNSTLESKSQIIFFCFVFEHTLRTNNNKLFGKRVKTLKIHKSGSNLWNWMESVIRPWLAKPIYCILCKSETDLCTYWLCAIITLLIRSIIKSLLTL